MSQYSCIALALFSCFKVYTAFLTELPKMDSSLDAVSPASKTVELKGGVELPSTWDWRVKFGVTPVKDQMQCSACYAFSTLANIESQLKIIYPEYGDVDLSEQFIIDCNDQNAQCHGASLIKTFADIVVNMGGVLRESDYQPYQNGSDSCHWDNNDSQLLPVIGFQRVWRDEDEIAKYIRYYGPVTAAINADMMVKYKVNSNVIDQPTEEECPGGKDHQHHAVLIVGYSVYESPDNSTPSVPYWIIKNSWGVDWGNAGYYYLERGTNACGIANDVSFAIIPEPQNI